MKRLLDIILSAICLVVFSPLFVICAVAIYLEDRLPVIYSQERVGLHGRTFRIYKFRSMRIDAEPDHEPRLLEITGDSRLTHVGRFLRNHHLDELPQLWNVLKGDMSFVGYRPERPYYINQIVKLDPRYMQLYAIRPGITSYATLYNGYTNTMEKMLRRLDLDLQYLHHHNLLIDARILLLTFVSIVSGRTF